MTMWKVISGIGTIAGGLALGIIIIAACIWLVAGVIGWLIDNSPAKVFGWEEEEELPMRDRISVPPPIPRPVTPPNPAAQVKAPPLSADQY